MALGVRLASAADPPASAPFSRGQRLADALTTRLGSWPFIIGQSVLLVAWLLLNTMAWQRHWDPYPFILLNLALSFQAAYSAPIIMMSQNRQAAKDRRAAGADAAVNQRSELDVASVHARLDELTGRQWRALVALAQGMAVDIWPGAGMLAVRRVVDERREERPGPTMRPGH